MKTKAIFLVGLSAVLWGSYSIGYARGQAAWMREIQAATEKMMHEMYPGVEFEFAEGVRGGKG